MIEVLQFLFTGFLAFIGCHYTLSLFWNNTVGVAVVAGVFAVLCAIFLGGVLR